MSEVFSKLFMIIGIISVFNINDIQQNISNPLMRICLICIGGLYIINGIKSSK